MIGIDEGTWQVTGSKAPGGGDLAQWASDCIVGLAPYFSPLPRFSVVDHPNGKVLIAGTARSINLIPTIVEGKPQFYIRFHDKSLKAPDYLISDLVLGRRQQPLLHVVDYDLVATGRIDIEDMTCLETTLRFSIENASMHWADDVAAGTVAFVRSTWHMGGNTFRTEVSGQIHTYLDVKDAKEYFPDNKCILLNMYPHPIGTLISFGGIYKLPIAKVYIPISTSRTQWNYNWKAAVYVMARGTTPTWYQVVPS